MSRCPQLPVYTDEITKGAADELRVAREQGLAQPNVRVLLKDYGQLRAECHALQSSGGGNYQEA